MSDEIDELLSSIRERQDTVGSWSDSEKEAAAVAATTLRWLRERRREDCACDSCLDDWIEVLGEISDAV
jgi:hypothetical protein